VAVKFRPTRGHDVLTGGTHPRSAHGVLQRLDFGLVRPPMTTDESFLEYVWQRVGAKCREHSRSALSLLERLDPEDRPKFLAAICWANWCRGRNDHAEGKEKFWEMK
jgi:hypothetical protein